MLTFIYDAGIYFYHKAIWLYAFFNQKANKWIAGRKDVLFSLDQDNALQSRNKMERARLTSLMLSQNQKNEATQKFKPKRHRQFHCNTIGEEGSELENAH